MASPTEPVAPWLLNPYAASILPAKGYRSRIRRFCGKSGSDFDWNALGKDGEVSVEEGDCPVYLFEKGRSQRSPSFKSSIAQVRRSRSTYLLRECLHDAKGERLPELEADADDHSNQSSLEATGCDAGYALFIPAPTGLDRSQVFSYHLTTRNYFAFLNKKPLVGELLSNALTDLCERIRQWHEDAADLASLHRYCEEQGYTDFTGNVHHALAMLKFAEATRSHRLWVDAFAHCVGMYGSMDLSPEFENLSGATKAQIMRASMETGLRLAKVRKAISGLLDEELNSEHLGLSDPARDHLDRFRSNVHSFYVDKFGYFPPEERSPWQEHPWHRMYKDFNCLYEYMVDKTDNDTTSGGICVLQNVTAFNERHEYEPMPHSLPLLPKPQTKPRSFVSQRYLRSIFMSQIDFHPSSSQPVSGMAYGLEQATNAASSEIMENSLVQNFRAFESERLKEKMSVAEARKVRWLFVYGTLQTLSSVVKPGAGLEHVKAPYPICSLTSACPPWTSSGRGDHTDASTPRTSTSVPAPSYAAFKPLHDRSPSQISIHPDCEAECATDYFTASRKSSFIDLGAAPTALRVNSAPLPRTMSIRSSVQNALHRSVVGSFQRGRRNSRSTASERQYSRASSSSRCAYREIWVAGYGNGMDILEDETRQAALHDFTAASFEIRSAEADSSTEMKFDHAEAIMDPIVEDLTSDAIQITESSLTQHASKVDLQRNSSGTSTGSNSSDKAFAFIFDHEDTADSDTDLSSAGEWDVSAVDTDDNFDGSRAASIFATRYGPAVDGERNQMRMYPASYVPTGAPVGGGLTFGPCSLRRGSIVDKTAFQSLSGIQTGYAI